MRVMLMQRLDGIAGSEKYLLSILPALASRGLDVSFILVRGPVENDRHRLFLSELAKAEIRTHVLETGSGVSPAFIWKLRALIARENVDVLHTNLTHSDVYGALVKLVSSRRFALVSGKHGYGEAYQAAHGFDPKALRWDRMSIATLLAGLGADAVFSISAGLAGLLTQGGLIARNKMKVIPYGFDFDMEPSRGTEGTCRYGARQIVSVSRLVAVKRLHVLVHAMPGLIKRYPDVKLVLVGDGPLRQSLEELVRSLGVTNQVVFEGFRDNVLDYFRDSDVFALSSSAEGFGRVILEAWWRRKPVVCFDVPAPNEIITHEHDGLLAPDGDQAAFARALERLLDDPSERERMGENGRQTYERRYTLDAMTQRTIELYRDALTRRGLAATPHPSAA